jgi:hypothetical protein
MPPMTRRRRRLIATMWWNRMRTVLVHLHQLQTSIALFVVHTHTVLFPVNVMRFREPRLTVARGPRVDLGTWEEADCIDKFRFTLPEIAYICGVMGFPANITVNKVTLPSTFAMAMMLRRLAYPCRLNDLVNVFGLDVSSIGRIINYMLSELIDRYGDRILFWPGLTPARIRKYAAAITQLEPAVIDIWGFIDGTFQEVAKPEEDEQASYSGYERGHGQKYQGVLCPDGLIVSLDGPYVGSKNDLNLLAESGLQTRIEPLVLQADGRHLQLFGDRFYRGQPLVMCPFGQTSDIGERRFNDLMAAQRVYVETGFGKITQYFCATDLRRAMRSGLIPTASHYMVSALMTNVHTCMHGSNIPWWIEPPSVEAYLNCD